MIRLPDGSRHVIAEWVMVADDFVWFELDWHLRVPADAIHVLPGPVQGEGPWKIAAHVINVLGCHGTDADLARRHADWMRFLATAGDYPARPLIEAIARKRVRENAPGKPDTTVSCHAKIR